MSPDHHLHDADAFLIFVFQRARHLRKNFRGSDFLHDCLGSADIRPQHNRLD
jgi:hypothetical protein